MTGAAASGAGATAGATATATIAAAPGTQPFAGPIHHVYIHVPYCGVKCDYCDFASVPLGTGVRTAGGRAAAVLDRFVDALAQEWERERVTHGVRRLHTLYIGGGTPSLLGPERLERLLEPFRPLFTAKAEVTVEANPDDVDEAFAAWAAGAGRRAARRPLRVSLGVQSFVPGLRKALGRRGDAEPAVAFALLRAAGVYDLGVDLIHGIPGQTEAQLEADVATVLGLRPAHIAWYELDVAAGTPLAARLAAGVTRYGVLPGEDERAAIYRRVVRELSRAGYHWYEVSNFALPGRRARHNAAYWRARPYLGLGPGAVSTVGARRWRNVPDPAAWLRAVAAGARPPREVEVLDRAARARERLLLAARCGAAVPLAEVTVAVDEQALAPLAAAGLISLQSGTIRVTRKGRYVANEVCVRLFRDTRLRG